MDTETLALVVGGAPPLTISELWGMVDFDDQVFTCKDGGGIAFLASSPDELATIFLRRGDAKAVKVMRVPYPYPIDQWCETMAQHHPHLAGFYSSVLAHHRASPPLVTVVVLFYDSVEKARAAARLTESGLTLIPPERFFAYLAAFVPPHEEGVAPPVPSMGETWPDLLVRALTLFSGGER